MSAYRRVVRVSSPPVRRQFSSPVGQWVSVCHRRECGRVFFLGGLVLASERRL